MSRDSQRAEDPPGLSWRVALSRCGPHQTHVPQPASLQHEAPLALLQCRWPPFLRVAFGDKHTLQSRSVGELTPATRLSLQPSRWL